MLFDFETFSRIAATVYNDKNPYSLKDCLSVFPCYFEAYEMHTGKVHPPIRASQISRIMQDMPFTDERMSIEDIPLYAYPEIIELHFKTNYRNCDFNINHFFSGRIRENRLQEWNNGAE